MLSVFLLILFVSFSVVIFFGAPYLPTLKKEKIEAIALLDLRKGELFLELGSGDGRRLKAMAKNQVFCIGYELNPLLVLISKVICWKQRQYVTVKWTNFWNEKLPNADKCDQYAPKKYEVSNLVGGKNAKRTDTNVTSSNVTMVDIDNTEKSSSVPIESIVDNSSFEIHQNYM